MLEGNRPLRQQLAENDLKRQVKETAESMGQFRREFYRMKDQSNSYQTMLATVLSEGCAFATPRVDSSDL